MGSSIEEGADFEDPSSATDGVRAPGHVEPPDAVEQTEGETVEPGPARSNPRPDQQQQPATIEAQLEAVARIYELYAPVLLSLAKRKLALARIPMSEYSDEEVLQSSLGKLLEDIKRGHIDAIADHSGCLRVLRRVIMDKVIARSRHLNALKRNPWAGGKRVDVGEGLTDTPWDDDEQHRIADTLDLEYCGVPSAEVDLISSEMVEKLMGVLEADLRIVVKMQLDHHSIADIAAKLDVSPRTIDRRLVQVRDIWAKSGLIDEHPIRRRKRGV
jgi:DNA-directed RNA polymerase specialized sigma24 family protein